MDRAGHQVPAANTTLARQPDFLGPAHACRSNTILGVVGEHRQRAVEVAHTSIAAAHPKVRTQLGHPFRKHGQLQLGHSPSLCRPSTRNQPKRSQITFLPPDSPPQARPVPRTDPHPALSASEPTPSNEPKSVGIRKSEPLASPVGRGQSAFSRRGLAPSEPAELPVSERDLCPPERTV